MTPKQVKEALKLLVPLAQPVFVWGAPGVGKSQVVAQVAEELDIALVDLRAVLLDPVDLRGLPTIEDGNTAKWCPPSFLPKDGRGILFLDELNAAPPLVQAACYQLVLDRKVGEYELPDGWTVVAAGNRESDRAVTHRMPSALANRFVHLDFEVALDDWLEWADVAEMPHELTSFIRFRPGLLHDFDPQKSEKAFPSPRTWEYVGRMLASDMPSSLEYELVKGAVGEGCAAEFAGFCKVYRELPTPESLLDSPEKAPVPEDPATLYALCEALAQKAGAATADRIMAYASRLPAEFGVLLVRGSVRNHRAMVETQSFANWATANSDVLI